MSTKRGPDMSEPTHEKVYQFVKRQSCPFVTTGDVAEEFSGVTDRTLRERLKDLVEQERLRSRRVGPHAKVWYLPSQESSEASTSSPSSVNQ